MFVSNGAGRDSVCRGERVAPCPPPFTHQTLKSSLGRPGYASSGLPGRDMDQKQRSLGKAFPRRRAVALGHDDWEARRRWGCAGCLPSRAQSDVFHVYTLRLSWSSAHYPGLGAADISSLISPYRLSGASPIVGVPFWGHVLCCGDETDSCAALRTVTQFASRSLPVSRAALLCFHCVIRLNGGE